MIDEMSDVKKKLVFLGLVIDLSGRRVMCCQKFIHLTAMEFDLLVYLANHAGRVCCFNELLVTVWGHQFKPSDVQLVRLCMSGLRQKFRTCACQGASLPIRTVRSIGYCFDWDNEPANYKNGYGLDI